ncbi:MAG TPA: hypothetical protein VJH92_03015 [Candidatus Nanoarchaeia archaeon]|nr:hypothetical protein [Candidatus Nanoarchaeia archaeon]
MREKIKLSTTSKDDYERVCKSLNKKLSSLPYLKHSFELDPIFFNLRGNYEVNLRPKASPLVPDNSLDIDWNAVVFDIEVKEDDRKELANLIKTKKLNKKTINSFLDYYAYVYEKPPTSLEEVFNRYESDEALTEHVLGIYYDTRYNRDDNSLSTHDIYSGRFSGKGLMSGFFRTIGEVIDFGDLNCISFRGIVEKSTCLMFNNLREKITDDEHLCEMLKIKHVKSPFMGLLNNVGFKEIEVVTSYGYIFEIRGKRNDDLIFKLRESKE